MDNPLLSREFLTNLRTRKAVVFGIIFILSLSALVMLLWPAAGAYSLSAQSSHALFMLLSMGQLVLVVMFAPAFTAVSITSEKERETYDLLYHTMLSPGQILLGKLSAGIGFSLILLFASLPMMGACYVLGGVSFGDVTSVYLLLLISAVFFGLLGMWCSCSFRSSYNALIMCYVFILAISGLTWVPSIILGSWAQEFVAIHMLRAISPFAAMISIVNPGLFSAEHLGSAEKFTLIADSMRPFVIFGIGGSIVLLFLSMRLIARPPQPRKRKDYELIDERMEALKRKVKFPFILFDPRRRKRMIGPILNIIAVKEMRTKAFGRVTWVLRAMYFSVIVSLLLAFLPLYQVVRGQVQIPTIILVCLSLPLGIILLVSPVLTSSSISSERESGVFEALRMTKLSAFTLVLGKLEVAWFFILLLVSSTFPTFFMLAYLSAPPGEMEKISNIASALRLDDFSSALNILQTVDIAIMTGMLHAFAVAIISIFFATVSGILCSVFLKKSSAATSAAYALVFFLGIGTLVPYFMAENLPHSLVELLVTLNPFAAAGKAASGQVFVSLSNDLWLNHIKIVGGISVVMLIAATLQVWFLMRPKKT